MAAPTSALQAFTTATVWDYCYFPDGTAANYVYVWATLDYNLPTIGSPAVNLEPQRVLDITDINGQFVFTLIPNSAISPAGTRYIIQYLDRVYKINVTGTATYQASSIVDTTLQGLLT